MQRVKTNLCLLVALTFMGCKTSRVLPRPLADVRQAVEEMQPDMLAEISPECGRAGLSTNDVVGVVYTLHIMDALNSGPPAWFPSLTVEARSKGDSRTKVTVTRVAVDRGASLGVARRRDLERHRLDALAAKLEETK